MVGKQSSQAHIFSHTSTISLIFSKKDSCIMFKMVETTKMLYDFM
jgi:hypothetical protein